MAAKPKGLLVVIATMLALAVVALSHEEPGVDTQQAAMENERSEDSFQNDKVQMPVTEKQQDLPIQSCADGTPGNEKVKELCQKDSDQSELDHEDVLTSSSHEECEAGHPLRLEEEKAKYLQKLATHVSQQDERLKRDSEEEKGSKFSGSIIQRSMQGLEGMLDQAEKSSVKMFEKLGGVMDQVGLSRKHMMKRLDTVIDRVSESVSESKVRVIKSLDSVMDRVSESVSKSKVRVIKSLDSLMDHVSASKTKMLKEIDHVIDKVAHSKVIEEIRAFPGEIQESFIPSVRNRSYVAAGVMVAITTAILVAGALYFAWCHQDAWSYHRVSPESLAAVTDPVNSTARVNYGENISNGHNTSCRGGHHAHDDINPVDEDSYEVVNGSIGTKDSDGKEEVSDVDEHRETLEESDVSLQLSLDSSHPEAAIKPEVEAADDDVHEVQLIEIPKEDIPNKDQQKGMTSRDEPQNSNTNEHQADSAFEYLLSKDTSHTLASVDISCAFQSKKDAIVGYMEPKDYQLGIAFFGHGLNVAVEVAKSDAASLGIPNTDGMINNDSVIKVTGNSLGIEDIEKKCQHSSVGTVKAETICILEEGTYPTQNL